MEETLRGGIAWAGPRLSVLDTWILSSMRPEMVMGEIFQWLLYVS